eukprot:5613261-Prymnesium_polylepis.1
MDDAAVVGSGGTNRAWRAHDAPQPVGEHEARAVEAVVEGDVDDDERLPCTAARRRSLKLRRTVALGIAPVGSALSSSSRCRSATPWISKTVSRPTSASSLVVEISSFQSRRISSVSATPFFRKPASMCLTSDAHCAASSSRSATVNVAGPEASSLTIGAPRAARTIAATSEDGTSIGARVPSSSSASVAPRKEGGTQSPMSPPSLRIR